MNKLSKCITQTLTTFSFHFRILWDYSPGLNLFSVFPFQDFILCTYRGKKALAEMFFLLCVLKAS